MEVEVSPENPKRKQPSKHKSPKAQPAGNEIQQVLSQFHHALEHDLKLDQFNSNEWVMVSYLRSWAKDGLGEIPHDHLDQCHEICKD